MRQNQAIQDYTAHPMLRRASLGLQQVPRLGPMYNLLGPLEYQWLYRPGQGYGGRGGGGNGGLQAGPYTGPGGGRGDRTPGPQPDVTPPEVWRPPDHGTVPPVDPPEPWNQPPPSEGPGGRPPPYKEEDYDIVGRFGRVPGRNDLGNILKHPVFAYLLHESIQNLVGVGPSAPGGRSQSPPGTMGI